MVWGGGDVPLLLGWWQNSNGARPNGLNLQSPIAWPQLGHGRKGGREWRAFCDFPSLLFTHWWKVFGGCAMTNHLHWGNTQFHVKLPDRTQHITESGRIRTKWVLVRLDNVKTASVRCVAVFWLSTFFFKYQSVYLSMVCICKTVFLTVPFFFTHHIKLCTKPRLLAPMFMIIYKSKLLK